MHEIINPTSVTSATRIYYLTCYSHWTLQWSEKCNNVEGMRLNDLKFADDIVIVSNNNNAIKKVLNQLSEASSGGLGKQQAKNY